MVTQKSELPNFHLRSCIGKACCGLANVYLAQDKRDKRNVAIRICHLDQTKVTLESLMQEISVLRNLQHRNVLGIDSCFVVDSSLCIAMPLADYGKIRNKYYQDGCNGYSIEIQQLAIAFILRDVLAALQYVHSMHYIHRAIRCSHILLSSHGGCRLSGFRHATTINRSGTRTGVLHEFLSTFQNNLLWLAPEVLQQDINGYGAKSDIYSLGISACEAANGFPPFADMEHMQMLYEKMRGTTPRLLDASTLPPTPSAVSSVEAVGEVAAEEDETAHREQRSRRFTDHFHDFTDAALRARPEERATLEQLASHPFFKQLKKVRHQSLAELLHPVKPLATTPVISPVAANTSGDFVKPSAEMSPSATDAAASWHF